MSFEKIPGLLELLLSAQQETNRLLEQNNKLLVENRGPTLAEAKSALPTPTISAQTEGRPLTAAEAPAALHGIANVGNAPTAEEAPTPVEPAPTPSAQEAAPVATVEPATASPSEVTVEDAKNAMLDVANKCGREAAVEALATFSCQKFTQLLPAMYPKFVAHCKSLVQ